MPGISPPHLTASPPKPPSRPTAINTSTNDPPPHIPALRPPTFPSIPNFEQLQSWANQGQRGEAEEREASATYLVRQRQRARVTIVGAASLTEPRDLPVYRPQAHHLCPYPYPPRSRISVYSRRVNVGPRVLGKGLWEPWRKGGVIEQDEVAKRRRRMRMWEDALQQEQILEAAKEAESTLENGDTEHGATHATNSEIDGEEKTCNTGFQALENDEVMRAAQGTAIVEQGILDAKQTRAEDEALLFAALAASFDSKACSDPEHTTEGTDTKGPPSDKATERDLDSMEVYIKDGVLVAPPNDQPASDSGTISKDAIPPLAQVSTESIAVTKLDDHLKYAPHTRSPLSQSFIPPPPIAPIYIPSARSEAEVLSAGKMWRRFTSMMF
ncbi:hypothetical protein FRC09_003877 [Ceratobasidium sp. 395]|nr:hypothetical protein FRC09_003877 [Ceratobasidium sp. 395]